jgi:hypothetical protein
MKIMRLALAVFAALPILASAQNPGRPQSDSHMVSEALAASLTLPASAGGALVMTPCAGCAPRSLRASATTTYFIGERQVTLVELKDDLIRRPQSIATVSYLARSGALLSISAEPAPAKRAATRAR